MKSNVQSEIERSDVSRTSGSETSADGWKYCSRKFAPGARKGHGHRMIPKDGEQAEHWYIKAAAAGLEQAQINLDDLRLTAKRRRIAAAPLIHLALFTAICVGVRI